MRINKVIDGVSESVSSDNNATHNDQLIMQLAVMRSPRMREGGPRRRVDQLLACSGGGNLNANRINTERSERCDIDVSDEVQITRIS